MAFHKAANDFQVTLNGAIGPTDVTITVTGDLTPIASILPVYLSIESEIIEVTAVVSQDMTAVRGTQGTAGAAHADLVAVDCNVTAAQINELIDDKQDAGGSVFGSDYNQAIKVADESSASTTPVLYHSFVTPILPAGSYLLTAYNVISGGSTSQIYFRELTIDAVQVEYVQQEPKDANNQLAWSVPYQFTVPSDASVTIELNYGKISGATNATMKQSKFILWRVF